MARPVSLVRQPVSGPASATGGHWLTVRLSRPERANALDESMLRALGEAFSAPDPGCRAIFLEAEGDTFSAGLDLHWLEGLREASRAEREAAGNALATVLDAVAAVEVPVVASVRRGAYGAGIALAAAADWVVAAPEARFRMSEGRLGISGSILLKTLRPRVRESWLRRWVLTAEDFDGRTALAAGLLTELVPEDGAAAHRAALESRFLAAAPSVLRTFKRALREPVPATTEGRLLAEALENPDGREGLSAYREKRPPRWTL